MLQLVSELMTVKEAAAWFRRSVTWVRRQRDLLAIKKPSVPAVYHVAVCRAYYLGTLRGLSGPELRQLQIDALEAACGVPGSNPRKLTLVPSSTARGAAAAIAR